MKTKTHQTAQAEWEQEFVAIFPNLRTYVMGLGDCDVSKKVKQFIRDLLQSHEKQTAEDICKLIDDIELHDCSNSSMEVWKLFKRIRNRIRDTYVPEGFQKEEEKDNPYCHCKMGGDRMICSLETIKCCSDCKGEEEKPRQK